MFVACRCRGENESAMSTSRPKAEAVAGQVVVAAERGGAVVDKIEVAVYGTTGADGFIGCCWR